MQLKYAEQKKTPLEEHLTQFENSLKKRSPKHRKLTMTRIRRIVKDCEFEKLSDIEKVSLESCLTEMIENEEIGHRTYNHYIQAMDSFCNWCVQNSRLIANPLVGLSRLNADVDVRHKRRALSSEDLAKLVQSARESGESISASMASSALASTS